MKIEVLKSELLAKIDATRKEMIKSAEVRGYASEKTVRCSQELDMFLNKYQQILFEEGNKTEGPFRQFVKTMKNLTFQEGTFTSSGQIISNKCSMLH
ncbi:aspartyl-phosphate phosphatase Spo0E family protein [Bacillus sp. EB600]|uniref:aspartyl-phosphate phosphatase Spo0E family protein n=1 Tax=Bacillus sp. EB600 TaxID=2806345 RepID=UPI00210EB69E|nr:aspartyl-phosphate phosphatase Spo0E family protein [Bacillus sp. EB600]MCQ6281210.1 aspartyl-phosphate phosphatase Spo0E family protein [Bacillus sp. EB600]